MDSDGPARCVWCRRRFDVTESVGRKRQYCRRSCRQRAYEARRLAALHGVSDDELIVTKRDFEQLLDQVYVLQAAIKDIDSDSHARSSASEMKRSLDWLLSAARPLLKTPLV